MTLVSVQRFQPNHRAFEPPSDENDGCGDEEIAPRVFQRGREMMKPWQLHERLIQPDRCSAVVEELRDVKLRNEDEPRQHGEKTKRDPTRACAGPGHDSPDRMTRSRRLDLKQVKAL